MSGIRRVDFGGVLCEMTIVLQMTDVSRHFSASQGQLTILNKVNLLMSSGSAIALRGPSGCGKSTLLHIAGTLDQPSSGTLRIKDEDPWTLPAARLAAFRNQHIGFVFQEHQICQYPKQLLNIFLMLVLFLC